LYANGSPSEQALGCSGKPWLPHERGVRTRDPWELSQSKPASRPQSCGGTRRSVVASPAGESTALPWENTAWVAAIACEALGQQDTRQASECCTPGTLLGSRRPMARKAPGSAQGCRPLRRNRSAPTGPGLHLGTPMGATSAGDARCLRATGRESTPAARCRPPNGGFSPALQLQTPGSSPAGHTTPSYTGSPQSRGTMLRRGKRDQLADRVAIGPVGAMEKDKAFQQALVEEWRQTLEKIDQDLPAMTRAALHYLDFLGDPTQENGMVANAAVYMREAMRGVGSFCVDELEASSFRAAPTFDMTQCMELNSKQSHKIREVLQTFARTSNPAGKFGEVIFRPTFCRFVIDTQLVSIISGVRHLRSGKKPETRRPRPLRTPPPGIAVCSEREEDGGAVIAIRRCQSLCIKTQASARGPETDVSCPPRPWHRTC